MPPNFLPPPSEHILDSIGNTPLVRLRRVTDGLRTPVYGKCEFMNPGASVKDRIGPAILEAAEHSGALRPGGVVVEGTSGNTGVGLALAASIKGYRCIFTVPDKMSNEKIKLLRALGAEVKVTPTVPPDHPDYYVTVARRLAEQRSNAVMADQFYNQANPEAHYRSTGPEVWEQSEGRITHFVAGMGTGGTITGAGRYLKERNPGVKLVAGDPVGSVYTTFKETGVLGPSQPYKVEGIGNDKIPDTCDLDLVDEVRPVTDKEAFLMTRRLSREEGLFVGGSSGLATVTAIQIAREVDDPGAFIVVVLADTGERYLSKVHSDEWMEEYGFLETAGASARDLLAGKISSGPGLVSAGEQMKVREALALMNQHGVTQLPVIEGDDCVGSVKEGLLMAAAIEDRSSLDRAVKEVMDPPFPVVQDTDPLEHVGGLIGRNNEAVLVRKKGKITGILTRYDLLQHLSLR